MAKKKGVIHRLYLYAATLLSIFIFLTIIFQKKLVSKNKYISITF